MATVNSFSAENEYWIFQFLLFGRGNIYCSETCLNLLHKITKKKGFSNSWVWICFPQKLQKTNKNKNFHLGKWKSRKILTAKDIKSSSSTNFFSFSAENALEKCIFGACSFKKVIPLSVANQNRTSHFLSVSNAWSGKTFTCSEMCFCFLYKSFLLLSTYWVLIYFRQRLLKMLSLWKYESHGNCLYEPTENHSPMQTIFISAENALCESNPQRGKV